MKRLLVILSLLHFVSLTINAQKEIGIEFSDLLYQGINLYYETTIDHSIAFGMNASINSKRNLINEANTQRGFGFDVKIFLSKSKTNKPYFLLYNQNNYGKWEKTKTYTESGIWNLFGAAVGAATGQIDVVAKSLLKQPKSYTLNNYGTYKSNLLGLGLGYHLQMSKKIVVDISLGSGFSSNRYKKKVNNKLIPKTKGLHMRFGLRLGYKFHT